MKYNDNGTYKDIYVKTFDTLPVGAIVEYSGSTIPSGWTDIGNNQIQKTSQYIEGGASLSNVYGTSNENGYTQEYINKLETYSTDEIRVGTWLGKPLYRKVITDTLPAATTDGTFVNKSINLSSLSMDTKFIKLGYLYLTAYNNIFEIPINTSVSDNVNYRTVVSFWGNTLEIRNNFTSWNNKDVIIVIEYTKTTD